MKAFGIESARHYLVEEALFIYRRRLLVGITVRQFVFANLICSEEIMTLLRSTPQKLAP